MHSEDPTTPTSLPLPATSLMVEPWPDPVLDELGHDPRSAYVERFWLPVMGPSSLLVVRRLADRLDNEPDGFELQLDAFAGELGLGRRGGHNSPIWRTLERTSRFRATRLHGETMLVRRHLDSLSGPQVRRLPDGLQRVHQQWIERRVQHRSERDSADQAQSGDTVSRRTTSESR